MVIGYHFANEVDLRCEMNQETCNLFAGESKQFSSSHVGSENFLPKIYGVIFLMPTLA